MSFTRRQKAILHSLMIGKNAVLELKAFGKDMECSLNEITGPDVEGIDSTYFIDTTKPNPCKPDFEQQGMHCLNSYRKKWELFCPSS